MYAQNKFEFHRFFISIITGIIVINLSKYIIETPSDFANTFTKPKEKKRMGKVWILFGS